MVGPPGIEHGLQDPQPCALPLRYGPKVWYWAYCRYTTPDVKTQKAVGLFLKNCDLKWKPKNGISHHRKSIARSNVFPSTFSQAFACTWCRSFFVRTSEISPIGGLGIFFSATLSYNGHAEAFVFLP